MKETLKEFLLKEVMLDVDPNDPNTVLNIKQKLNKAKRNPDRVNRDQVIKAKDDIKTAQKSDSPTKSIDIKIARLKQQVATLTVQKQQIQKRTKTTESVEYPENTCEVVYTNESGDIIHIGSILTEASIKAYKKSGNVIKRQYRCTSGKKEGKIVAQPNDCNKRPNPKRVKAGRKSAKKSKSIRIHKTKLAKNKSISKMVTSLNQRLKH